MLVYYKKYLLFLDLCRKSIKFYDREKLNRITYSSINNLINNVELQDLNTKSTLIPVRT